MVIEKPKLDLKIREENESQILPKTVMSMNTKTSLTHTHQLDDQEGDSFLYC